MTTGLECLDAGARHRDRRRGDRDPPRRRAVVSGAEARAAAEPTNLAALKQEIITRWATLDLLDVCKEADFLTEFTSEFTSVAAWEVIDRATPCADGCCSYSSRWGPTSASARS